MERITRFRAGIILTVFLAIIGFFVFKLHQLQIVETGGETDNTTYYYSYVTIKAARGDILDSNGNAMVSNRASYNLMFNHYIINSAENTNQHLLDLIDLCQELEIEYVDHFPITKARPYEYTLSEYSSSWRSYFQAYLANKGIDSDITAPLLMQKLRSFYKIPAEWTDSQARLVIGLRYELALRGLTNISNYIFVEDASEEALAAILELNTPGLTPEASTVREYNTEYAAHILGYVGAMTPEQWEYYQNVEGYEMDAKVGQSGLEAAFEKELHGIDGLREDKHTADGTLVSSRYIREPKAGNHVICSLDLNLQRISEDSLASTLQALRADEDGDGNDAEGGAVVVMEVGTGKILASASYPTFNLARYFEDYEEILKIPFNALYNRVLLATYPPGSTYKMSMVIAGIDNHVINSETLIKDEGVYMKYAPGIKPKCLVYTLTGKTHGECNCMRALSVSCNYFFYVLGDMLTEKMIDDVAKGLGLGESTGVELAEDIGHRANSETKAKLYSGSDAFWFKGDQVLAAIGQSENKFTPLQLCVYACTLANKGIRYRATYLDQVVSSDYRKLVDENKPEIMSQMDISDEAYLAYVTGMKMVANEGTASSIFKNYPIQIAAKTGTAETGKYGVSDNGAFVCFAPADNPQIAIVVYAEQAGHGSSLAAVAKAILDYYFNLDEISEVSIYENQLG